MPRMEYRFSISIKDRKTGEQFTVHLIETLWPGKFWLRFKGKRSEKHKALTTTEMAQKILRWINKQQVSH